MFILIFILLFLRAEAKRESFEYIFRDSALLHEVQMRKVFDDPEEFLRLKLLKPQREIMFEYRELKLFNIPAKKRKGLLKRFINANFENISGLEPWTPPDFKKSPKLLNNIQDGQIFQKLKKFNGAWLKNGRKLTKDVIDNPERYSFITVPKPFFVCSEKKYEMGYWETFWIFQGLMACDMVESAKNLMENIFSIIDKLGYCPPYNRVYYKGRTSPPMLPFMMSSYLERTNDTDFLARHVSKMDSDLTSWIRQRLTLLQTPFHYFFIVVEDWWGSIRPEHYREDIERLKNYRSRSTPGPREMFWEVDNSVMMTSVFFTAVTEASTRLMVPWLRQFGYIAKARYFQNISKEMNYTLNNLLRVSDCWRNLHMDEGFLPESCFSLSPMWLGTASLPCSSAKQIPASTGPEAVAGSREQAWAWILDLYRVHVDNLVDIAAAFHIARTIPDLLLEHPPQVESARVKPPSLSLLILFVIFFRYLLSLPLRNFPRKNLNSQTDTNDNERQ
ncbi:trehalase [Halyomorpha halys]|uniref:trehalase n=1 Tax=Halyomorpha halys TaxID=286706 RepID=UPI0006D526E2|nr:trehalase-like [Halyomorpha halys]